MKILIVEDDPDDRSFITFAFQELELGNIFDFVQDGEEAINYMLKVEKSKKLCPCLIILDLNIPKKTGKEVIQWLKSHPCYRMIPIVVLTTSKDKEELNSVYALGASAYFIKPFSISELSEIIKRIYLLWMDGTATLPTLR